MSRRSIPQSVTDDTVFPVRVKVLVLAGGFGPQFDRELYAWLDRKVGRADYAQHPAKMFSEHAVAFHFRDVEPTRRFLEAFPGLTLADGTVTAAYTSPALPHGRDRRRAVNATSAAPFHDPPKTGMTSSGAGLGPCRNGWRLGVSSRWGRRTTPRSSGSWSVRRRDEGPAPGR